ncbi:2-succinyl-6-hydroxy-2,4-cyclohexadiene-1-carboxylate synthase [Lysinibacillus fusiformis]|uniref:2-succinyl-6-hydroxy-2, 4-cyclohexadiene-1-carboxylate synthase n=1 Tax=Lysinibacillus fusiformis TaxID=28031 RepID=UPI000D3BFD98|nr:MULTISPECIES: 2-succinyl-6-hydroxy-2,4-cyclohexadiene-1-carboxylate synthase [Lysinibacillus]MCG7435319.1 2-succinyl-6-hydroxy-2,4-cyclohexadiene-1-carboxylate synthase [Lysinibacillus fusiformis]MED4670733.1 2-succinyl-6-hydroxy-2,4-cyclohexadiene-1-carboxylate synthase [Lysinibacillus fusiformis]QAS57129.1 2-succinyl-6-hydroxy-2,4-cyclohexadiene-1-carboxylate synthase [Lysinibacillus sphaericus]RDV26222.1 2-succinyl-6-hydroxy-2,4-cyclohexadiene-1-carboxylate synthase [Lysinibacillus fusifo
MTSLLIRGLKTHVDIWNENGSYTLVALHGFTGSTATWYNLAQSLPDVRVIAIDLIGHGQTATPEQIKRFSMEEQLQDLEELFCQLHMEKFTLLGYSMGGRIALSYAIAFPDRIQKLILESASPGLRTVEERRERSERDDILAQKIITNGLVSFVNSWENIPLFASQRHLPATVRKAIRAERLSQREEGLAGSLRGVGTGTQPSNWHLLDRLEISVLLITGSLDEKFCKIALEMKALLKTVRHMTVIDAGHAIHVENPAEFATIVEEYIT